MEFAEVKKYLEDNKENDQVKDFLQSLKDEKGTIDKYKTSKEYRTELQQEGDRRVTKGIDTFKENTLPGLIEDEIKKRFPDETKEQKEVRELKQKLDNIEKESKLKELKLTATGLFAENKLNNKFMSLISAQDEESLKSQIGIIKEIVEEDRISWNTQQQRNAAFTPPKSVDKSGVKQLTRDDLKGMSPEAINKARAEGQLNDLLQGK